MAFSNFPTKKTVADTQTTVGPVQMQSAIFVATAAAAACTIQDEAGNDLVNFGSGLAAGFYSVAFSKPLRLAGFKVSTLTNGIAYLYLL